MARVHFISGDEGAHDVVRALVHTLSAPEGRGIHAGVARLR
ncbi:hypothetical protein OHB00_29430 [Streptomyces sp. NBC_00631]